MYLSRSVHRHQTHSVKMSKNWGGRVLERFVEHLGVLRSGTLFDLEGVFRGHPRQSQEYPRIADDGIRPELLGGLLQKVEVLTAHLYVDLNRPLSA